MIINHGPSATHIEINNPAPPIKISKKEVEDTFTVDTPGTAYGYLKTIKNRLKDLLNLAPTYTATSLKVENDLDNPERCSMTVSGSFGDTPCTFTLQDISSSGNQVDFSQIYARSLLGAISKARIVHTFGSFKRAQEIHISYMLGDKRDASAHLRQSNITVEMKLDDGKWYTNDMPLDSVSMSVWEALKSQEKKEETPDNTPEKLRNIPMGSVVNILAPDTWEFLPQPKSERDIAAARYYGVGRNRDMQFAIFVEDDGEIALIKLDCFDELDVELIQEGSLNQCKHIDTPEGLCIELGTHGSIFSKDEEKPIRLENGVFVLSMDGRIMEYKVKKEVE